MSVLQSRGSLNPSIYGISILGGSNPGTIEDALMTTLDFLLVGFNDFLLNPVECPVRRFLDGMIEQIRKKGDYS